MRKFILSVLFLITIFPSLMATPEGDNKNVTSLTTTIAMEEVTLEWTPSIIAQYFEVERAHQVDANGNLIFKVIARVEGQLSFSDTDLKENTLYYYRVAQINAQGEKTYTDIATANFVQKDHFTASVSTDPTFSILALQINTAQESEATLSMETTSGLKVYENNLSLSSGFNVFDLPLPKSIQEGTYILNIACNDVQHMVLLQKESTPEFMVTVD